jgi:hypothetical protein
LRVAFLPSIRKQRAVAAAHWIRISGMVDAALVSAVLGALGRGAERRFRSRAARMWLATGHTDMRKRRTGSP